MRRASNTKPKRTGPEELYDTMAKIDATVEAFKSAAHKEYKVIWDLLKEHDRRLDAEQGCGWDNGGWFDHCWFRGRRHWWTFLGYRRWPYIIRRVCQRCGRKQEREL